MTETDITIPSLKQATMHDLLDMTTQVLVYQQNGLGFHPDFDSLTQQQTTALEIDFEHLISIKLAETNMQTLLESSLLHRNKSQVEQTQNS